MELRPYQNEAVDAVLREWDEGHRKTLLVLPTGCHAIGQKLLMADGTARSVEDIRCGDKLLGSDGSIRTVLHRTEGVSDMYEIIPIKGKPFTVTSDHKLTLVKTNISNQRSYACYKGGEIIDVPVSEWLTWSKYRKHIYKLIRCRGVDRFDRSTGDLDMDPYFLGILLGDGGLKNSISVTTAEPEVHEFLEYQAKEYGMHLSAVPAGKAYTYIFKGNGTGCKGSLLHRQLKKLCLRNCLSHEKCVPEDYKYAPKETRLQVLAGLLDSDGYLSTNGYDFVSKSRQLSEDLMFMARSVGLAAYLSECVKGCGDYEGNYYRVSVSGDCSIIPCRVRRRKATSRKQKKNVLHTGFTCRYVGKQPYVGFTVDGDNRYLLDDFTITHNCGKTIVFSKITQKQVQKGHRALILAHRGELLDQAADKLMQACGLPSVLEKAESSGIGSNIPVTVGSVQTLCRDARLSKFPSDYFSDIVVDEAHHCLSDSYQKVLNHFPTANVLGVTATPDRGDQKNLGTYFDSKAYEYSMSQAIREGYLCPVKAQMIPLELDIGSVGISGGDYAVNDIGHALEPYLRQIATEMANYCHGRKTVVFLPLIKTSQEFCELLRCEGLTAAEVNGNSADRAEILQDFENGKYDVLCNSMLLTEGWDCPAVDCVVVLRPTKVRSLYQQMVGRGMRLSPGKDHLLLLDFLWMTERHDLCRPSALISKDENVAKKMDEQLMKDDTEYDLIEAEAQAERDVLAEREEALARELAEMRKRKRKLVDPLQYAMSIAAEDLANYVPTFAWEMAPPSQKQLEFLEKRGIFSGSVQNMGMASMIIDRLKRRQEEGLATPKQIRCLERYGFSQVGTWRFEDASSMISRLSMNNWMVPYGLVPAQYKP